MMTILCSPDGEFPQEFELAARFPAVQGRRSWWTHQCEKCGPVFTHVSAIVEDSCFILSRMQNLSVGRSFAL